MELGEEGRADVPKRRQRRNGVVVGKTMLIAKSNVSSPLPAVGENGSGILPATWAAWRAMRATGAAATKKVERCGHGLSEAVGCV